MCGCYLSKGRVMVRKHRFWAFVLVVVAPAYGLGDWFAVDSDDEPHVAETLTVDIATLAIP